MTSRNTSVTILILLVCMMVQCCMWTKGDYFAPNSKCTYYLSNTDIDEIDEKLLASINGKTTNISDNRAKFTIDVVNESKTYTVKFVSAEIRFSKVNREYCFIKDKLLFQPIVEVMPSSTISLDFDFTTLKKSDNCDLSKFSEIEYELDISFKYEGSDDLKSLVFYHQVIKRASANNRLHEDTQPR